MKLVKQIGYKLIVVICIVMTFCCFIASTPVEASKVSTSDFYYSGTMKGSYTVEKGFLEKIVESLDDILDYILGIMTMGIRIVFVGWTALLERCLTWIIEGATGENINIESTSTTEITESENYITLDAIVFNRVPLLDINVFNFEIRDDVTATGEKKDEEETTIQGETAEHDIPRIVYINNNNEENIVIQGKNSEFKATTTVVDDTDFISSGETEDEDDSFVMIFKKAIAGWYYTFRLISIMIMLVLLVYIGIKLAIQSVASDKALYKRILVDWLVGMILVFSIHYIIVAIIQFNEILVEQIYNIMEGAEGLEVYEYGLIERAQEAVENDEIEKTLYQEIRTRAYDAKLTVGFSGMIMYMVLVYYAWKYTFIYLKRYLTVAVLIIIAPLIALSYAFNKVRSGKATIFVKWLKEFFFIVILQSIHALTYAVFVDTAFRLSLTSISGMILSFVALNFMCKSEGIFRKIFGLTGDLTDSAANAQLSDIKKTLGAMSLGVAGSKIAKKVTKSATKPARMAAEFGFGKLMEKRANSEKYQNKINSQNVENAETVSKLRLGEVAQNIKNGQLSGDKLREAVLALKEDIPFSKEDEDGNIQMLSDDEYLEEFNKNKEQYADNYDEIMKMRSMLKLYGKGKWNEIMNPFQYVEKGEDGKYKRIKTKRKNGKKVDSVGMKFANHMKAENLLGINKETAKAIQKQLSFIAEEIIGFGALLLGIPLLIAEPKIGMGLLAKGISSSNKVFGSSNRARLKNLKGFVMLPNGKYTFAGYEKNSKATIIDGAQALARESVDKIAEDEAKLHIRTVKRIKKHPKLLKNLAAGTAVAATIAFPVIVPFAAGTVLHGRILSNFHGNAYMAMHDTLRAAKKQAGKAWEEDIKSTNDFLDKMAEQYLMMSLDKQELIIDEHANNFANEYQKIIEDIDEMDKATLLREVNYQKSLEIEQTKNGKIKLSSNSEKTIIDNAIIEVIEQSGNMDIRDYDLSDAHIDVISKKIENQLIKMGLLKKGVKSSEIILDLKSKIKERKAKLDKENSKIIEEKIVDDSIIESMKEDNITNPNEVSKEKVLEKVKEKISNMTGGPSKESANAISKMQAQKGTSEDSDNTNTIISNCEQIIDSRKESLTSKATQEIDESESKRLKEQFKTQTEMELNVRILETQDRLNEGDRVIQDGDSDNVIKLLQLQTAMHKDKEKLKEMRKTFKEEKMLYKAQILNNDGSIKMDSTKDGSRRVTASDKSKSLSFSSEMSVEDILKTINKKT